MPDDVSDLTEPTEPMPYPEWAERTMAELRAAVAARDDLIRRVTRVRDVNSWESALLTDSEADLLRSILEGEK